MGWAICAIMPALSRHQHLWCTCTLSFVCRTCARLCHLFFVKSRKCHFLRELLETINSEWHFLVAAKSARPIFAAWFSLKLITLLFLPSYFRLANCFCTNPFVFAEHIVARWAFSHLIFTWQRQSLTMSSRLGGGKKNTVLGQPEWWISLLRWHKSRGRTIFLIGLYEMLKEKLNLESNNYNSFFPRPLINSVRRHCRFGWQYALADMTWYENETNLPATLINRLHNKSRSAQVFYVKN